MLKSKFGLLSPNLRDIRLRKDLLMLKSKSGLLSPDLPNILFRRNY